MKNLKTPRTLADCDFTVGYPEAPRSADSSKTSWAYWLLCIVGMASLGVLLAWRG